MSNEGVEMGQKQRKDAEIKGIAPMTAMQSDNSKTPENKAGEVMEHSQKNASLAPVPCVWSRTNAKSKF